MGTLEVKVIKQKTQGKEREILTFTINFELSIKTI